MITIQTTKGIFLFIELPINLCTLKIHIINDKTIISSYNEILYILNGNYEYLTNSQNITSSIAEQIVDNKNIFGIDTYKEYFDITWASYPYEDSLESFNSILKNKFFDIEKNYLILQQL